MSVNWSSITTIGQILAVPNTNTGGWFWLAMLFLIFFVVLIILLMKEAGTEVSLLASGFVGLVGAIFLVYMDLLAWQWALFFVGLLTMLFLYIVWSSKSDNM